MARRRARRNKKAGLPRGKPGAPSVLTGPVHPFGSLAALSAPPSGRLRAHSFASPPRDGFAFIEDKRYFVCDGWAGYPADKQI
jgi:hypothetical protein